MTKYFVAYDPKTGAVTTRYDGDIQLPPAGVSFIEVPSQAEMMQTCSGGWTIVNGALVAPPAPTAAQLLGQAQSAKIAMLAQAYQAAIQQPVSYTSKGGITKTYQADPPSVSNLQNAILGMQAAAATPSSFYWMSADNTQVPFAFADLQALAAAFLAQGWAEFQHLQTLKAEVLAATTVSAVQAIVW